LTGSAAGRIGSVTGRFAQTATATWSTSTRKNGPKNRRRGSWIWKSGGMGRAP
jgi:hypothetical protein